MAANLCSDASSAWGATPWRTVRVPYNAGCKAVRAFLPKMALSLLCVAASIASDFEGTPVADIRFDPRTQPLDAIELQGLLTVKQGDPLDMGDVRESIVRLFETGRYANIEVEAVSEAGGLTLVFHTEANRFVGAVEVLGVPAPPRANQLSNATELRLGQPLTRRAIARAQQNIRRLLAQNGFLAPVIDVEETADPETQQVHLVFRVKHAERARIGDLLMTGDGPLAAEEARRIAKWGPQDELTEPRIEDGLERIREDLHERDFWQSEASIVGRDYNPDENRVDLVLYVSRGPSLVVRLEGLELPRKRLERLLPIYEEGVADQDLLVEGARNLRDYLQGQGFFDAQVDAERERNTDEVVEAVYRVDRGPRQKLVQVSVDGNLFFDEATIRERMAIQASSLQLRRGRFSQSLLDRDTDSIERLYRTNGFRDVRVETRLERDFRGKSNEMAVFFQIDEGTPTFVEELRVEGMDNFPGREFRFSAEAGQPFSEITVATDRDLILAEYYDAGYHDATFDWAVQPGSDERHVKVEYTIREGERLFVKRSIISGLNHTELDLVRSQVLLRPDEPLSQTAMFETQRRLYDLGVFSKVDVALQNPSGDEPSKNVLFQLEEARRWAIGFGGGAEFARIGGGTADISSPVGEATFSPRVTVEVTRLNMRGLGRTLSLRSRVSTLQQRALLTYENPRWTGSEKWKMTLSGLYDTSRNVRTFTGARLEGALQLEHRLSKASTGLYRYTYRRTTIDSESLQIQPELIPLTAQPVRAALLSGTYIQDRRDDPTDATRGVFNTVDLSLASGVWGSQPDFIRFFGQNSTYHRISNRLVLARTAQLGLIAPWSDRERLDDAGASSAAFSSPDPRIPISERFFAGGAISHRGFPFNQAGPRDPVTGFPLGGGAELLNSVELRFPLVGENIGGVLFHDIGNVFSRPSDIALRFTQRSAETADGERQFDYNYLVQAVGFGLRYRTPIGPVRVDLGYSINPPRFIGFSGTRAELLAGQGKVREQQISHFQFHFSLGQTF